MGFFNPGKMRRAKGRSITGSQPAERLWHFEKSDGWERWNTRRDKGKAYAIACEL
jgi:hypothetical protein